LMTARRSKQKEINIALDSKEKGAKVFPATLQFSQCQLLKDDDEHYITANLPDEMFYHQMLICGKTGTGKTVASKYLAQYFVEELGGAILAINVKDVDFLKMNHASITNNKNILDEWTALGSEAHGIDNFTIYYPANTEISQTKKISKENCAKITLDVKKIEPESLTGLLKDISDIGAQHLPSIFRYWKEITMKNADEVDITFSKFVEYFIKGEADQREFRTFSNRKEEGIAPLHKGTFDNILRSLEYAKDFFDNREAKTIDENDILSAGKMSVIDVSGRKGRQFGSILLRDLLHRIVEAKSEEKNNVPILIIIDEVHMFYNTKDASLEALGDLDVICRTGRSQEIGVIFSSQNPSDIPRGLSSVINTKIFFKSDANSIKNLGISIPQHELENLKKGYAIAEIYDLPQLKIMKFPLSYAGVFEKEK
jgi:uncharacterized protein